MMRQRNGRLKRRGAERGQGLQRQRDEGVQRRGNIRRDSNIGNKEGERERGVNHRLDVLLRCHSKLSSKLQWRWVRVGCLSSTLSHDWLSHWLAGCDWPLPVTGSKRVCVCVCVCMANPHVHSIVTCWTHRHNTNMDMLLCNAAYIHSCLHYITRSAAWLHASTHNQIMFLAMQQLINHMLKEITKCLAVKVL